MSPDACCMLKVRYTKHLGFVVALGLADAVKFCETTGMAAAAAQTSLL